MSIAGTRLAGRYTLIRPLGRGASSVVYLAMGDDGQPCTVKLFHVSLTENARREAGMQVSSPYLGKALEVTELSGHPAVIGRLILGQPLFQFYRLRPALQHTPRSFIQSLLDVLGALEAMHGAGLLHRDIKPDNILVKPDGHAVLVDYDLSGPIREEFKHPRRIGTEAFQSPEAGRGTPLEPSSDLWSVGILLYWGLHGELPAGPVQPGPSQLSRLSAKLLDPVAQLRPSSAAETRQLLLEAAKQDLQLEFDATE